jgi:hypothetical protein
MNNTHDDSPSMDYDFGTEIALTAPENQLLVLAVAGGESGT